MTDFPKVAESTLQNNIAPRPLQLSLFLSSLRLSGGVLLVIECFNRLAARGHQITLIIPGDTCDPMLRAQLHPAIQLLETSSKLTQQRSAFSLLQLVLSMAWAAPTSQVLIATHTPTIVPTLFASLFGRKGKRVWLYMDYPFMFEKRPLEAKLLRWAPRWFQLLLPISQPLADELAKQTSAPIVVVRSGLPREHLLAQKPESTEPKGDLRILYVGDDRPRKGLREFLAAAERIYAQFPNTKFVVVSKQPCRIDLSAPYEFHLLPSDEELAALYQSSDLFVSTSWGEGLGYPPLEAMRCGLPVIVTDSGGVRDYARDGENCLLIPARDVESLTAAMAKLIDSPLLCSQLAAQGVLIAHHYHWDTMVAKMEEALESLL